jgi:hypothetical protein
MGKWVLEVVDPSRRLVIYFCQEAVSKIANHPQMHEIKEVTKVNLIRQSTVAD